MARAVAFQALFHAEPRRRGENPLRVPALPREKLFGEAARRLRLPRRPHRFGDFDRYVALLQINLVEGDAALEFPRVLRSVDADVVDSRSGHEADGAAAVVEGAAVAG